MTASRSSSPLLFAINHVLDQADWARQKLQPFAGRTVRMSMRSFSLIFVIGNDGRMQGSNAEPELDIVLPANTPFLALQGGDQVMKATQINGPADLAEALSLVLRHLRWDMEEDLSKIFGDIAAHRLASALKSFGGWQRQAARNLAENIGEYVVEENPILVKSGEIKEFSEEVARLCDNLSGVESRINQLTEESA